MSPAAAQPGGRQPAGLCHGARIRALTLPQRPGPENAAVPARLRVYGCRLLHPYP